MKNCEQCSKTTSNPRFCSLSCSTRWQALARPWAIGYCRECGKVFSRHPDRRKKFCNRTCSSKFNNKSCPKRAKTVRNGACVVCGDETPSPRSKYCLTHRRSIPYDEYINLWLRGDASGNGKTGVLSSHVRKWMILSRNNKCELCGWGGVHPDTGDSVMQVDHEDGNAANSLPSNLRLLCPRCHVMTPTYGGRNRGQGRPGRRERYLPASSGSM